MCVTQVHLLVEVRRQVAGIGSFLPLSRSWRSNSTCQGERQSRTTQPNVDLFPLSQVSFPAFFLFPPAALYIQVASEECRELTLGSCACQASAILLKYLTPTLLAYYTNVSFINSFFLFSFFEIGLLCIAPTVLNFLYRPG